MCMSCKRDVNMWAGWHPCPSIIKASWLRSRPQLTPVPSQWATESSRTLHFNAPLNSQQSRIHAQTLRHPHSPPTPLGLWSLSWPLSPCPGQVRPFDPAGRCIITHCAKRSPGRVIQSAACGIKRLSRPGGSTFSYLFIQEEVKLTVFAKQTVIAEDTSGDIWSMCASHVFYIRWSRP